MFLWSVKKLFFNKFINYSFNISLDIFRNFKNFREFYSGIYHSQLPPV